MTASADTTKGTNIAEAVVAFVDLCGSTAAKDRYGHDVGLNFVKVFRAVVHDEVRKKGGQVVKFLGDGALLNFKEGEYPGQRCLLAVEAILDRMHAHEVPPDVKLPARAAIARGLVEELPIADPHGKPVDIAARMEGLAKGSQILVTENFARGDDSHVSWKEYQRIVGKHRRASEASSVKLKGVQDPVKICEVVRDGQEMGVERFDAVTRAKVDAILRLSALTLFRKPETYRLTLFVPEIYKTEGFQYLVVARRFLAGQEPDHRSAVRLVENEGLAGQAWHAEISRAEDDPEGPFKLYADESIPDFGGDRRQMIRYHKKHLKMYGNTDNLSDRMLVVRSLLCVAIRPRDGYACPGVLCIDCTLPKAFTNPENMFSVSNAGELQLRLIPLITGLSQALQG